MNDILEILKYTLPSIVVIIAVWILIKHFLKSWETQLKLDSTKHIRKDIIKLKLQAYERVALFLERITADSLLVREKDNSLNSRAFHQKLLASIRAEYEHNLSQQIYMSPEAWQVVKNAKEGVIKMINQAAMETKPEDPAIELSKKIIDIQMEINTSPAQIALEFINKEIRGLLN